jgi:BirA family biotin operon repressor/biotin-[acetyl-CoA-carboxylase] ligase
MCVDSTNNYALDQLHAKLAAHGHTFFAHEQTAGKGQHGKNWTTEPNSNIIVSIIIDTNFIALYEQFYISAMAALAVHDFFSSYASKNTTIKWPNDIYWNNKKAAGILIETAMIDSNRFTVLGIGININQTHFDAALKNPISLQQITGKKFDTIHLAKQLCVCVEKRYQQLHQKKFDVLLKNYNEVLFKKGELVKLKKTNIVFDCIIDSVNAQGELEVKNALQTHFNFGEVEWVIENF